MISLRRRILLALIPLLPVLSTPAEAQFSSNGDDPGKLRWFRMDTPSYRLIYPAGLDSLAKVYGNEFERFRLSESISSGLVPGEGYRRRTPVILHAWHGVSNGAVTWAPKRIDIYTLPDAYDPEPVPWVKSLAVHESRHLAQMQFGYKGWLRPLTYILGDMAPGAYSAIWPSTWFLEGDAVVAETALTETGRGRTADFLDYYMMAFGNGDWRNWYRWRYGSYRHYTPNHYALGYMTIAGARYCFDDPLFTERYFSRIASNPFRFFNTQKNMRLASGKSFRESFSTIMGTFHDIWEEDARARQPFTPAERVENTGKWFVTTDNNTSSDGHIYSITSSYADASALTDYDIATGTLKTMRPFSGNADGLAFSNGKLWWSESVPDARWSLKMTSRIRSYDIHTGRTRSLNARGRLFNPTPSDDGSLIAAVSYPVSGGSAIVLLNAESGDMVRSRTVPDSLQAVETCFMGDRLIFSTVSEGGTGLYSIGADLDGDIECILKPVKVSIRNMQVYDGRLYFTSDRDGTHELYSIGLDDGSVKQHSSLQYGGDEFCFIGQDVYFTMLTKDGRLLHRTSISSIPGKEVDFNDIHHYKVADKLSEQEKAFAELKCIRWPDSLKSFSTTFSQPERYRKPLNILRFHSWAPVYFNYDKVRSMSGDFSYETASAGATALFQNSLGTAWGSIGYSFHRDPYSHLYTDGSHKFRHSAHLLFTYSGLYPVFEFSADFNDNAAVQYTRQEIEFRGMTSETIVGIITDKPSFYGSAKVYIPLNFSSGGWSRGLIPQFRYTGCNDLFDKSLTNISYDGNFSGKKGPAHFTGYHKGKNVFMQTVNASVRGYILRNVPESGTYPRYGAGAEAGYSARVLLDDVYSSSAYVYAYGYLPGLSPVQGLKITARYQHQFEAGTRRENSISVAPRGFDNSGAEYFIRNNSANHLKITADYVIPLWFGDISALSPVAYIKNFELTPHFDYIMFSSSRGCSMTSGGLLSAGASLVAKLANLLWIPYGCSIGITASYNGGSSFRHIKNSGYRMDSHYIGFLFNISL